MAVKPCTACGYQPGRAACPPERAGDCPVCDLVDLLRGISQELAERQRHDPVSLSPEAAAMLGQVTRERTSFLG